MPVKWKKLQKMASPQTVLDRLASSISVEAGRISFTDFAFQEQTAVLETMLSFPRGLDSLEKQNAIQKAAGRVKARGHLDKASFLGELNQIAKEENDKPETAYTLVTSISVDASLPIRRAHLEGCVLRFSSEPLPKKYSSREGVIREASKKFRIYHPGFLRCYISTRAKSEKAAAHKCLRALDLFRAYCNLQLNYASQIILGPDSERPLNRVRTGETHTLHKSNGQAIQGQIWYEPNFKEPQLCPVSKPEVFKKNFNFFVKKTAESSYSSTLIDALLRGVRALDETNHNNGLVRLWAAIECLTCPDGASYEKLVSRCAFLFDDADYQRQVLNHLREYRNSNIHAGEERQAARDYCFQAQRFFQQLIYFHFHHANYFSSLKEANEFLDLPTEKEDIYRLRRNIEKCISFRRLDENT